MPVATLPTATDTEKQRRPAELGGAIIAADKELGFYIAEKTPDVNNCYG